ncbi:MAG TPA: hypothetical protein VIV11_12780, partial [Kofleriaceae bacterium]
KDEPCCGNVCGANLTCDATSMSCVCGVDEAPCCGGDTCGANLVCGASAVCACGGYGEPCCGGSTCDAGATCSAGTCSGGATQVAIGAGHICALRPDRSVWCWGNDYLPWKRTIAGVLVPTLATTTPTQIDGVIDVAEIQAGELHSCARKMDGTLWCWGHNECGQLGNGTNTSSKIATQIMGLSNVTKFAGGRMHTCAVGSYNGTAGMWCWGRNSRYDRSGGTADATFGRLGNNQSVDSNVPVAVDLSAAAANGQTVRALSTGSYHTCMVMSDNTVWCWGKGGNGQLGNGATASSKVPVQVNLAGVTLGNATIDEVTCSDGSGYTAASTCMRLSTGAVYCWGAANELGDGSTVARNAPTTPVTTTALGSATFTQIASAGRVHCGVTTAGDVWCWGYNQQGVLGIDDATNTTLRATPAKTTVLTGATQLDMSHRTACAIDMQQQLWCWGTNKRGAIRDATTTRVQEPTKVSL